MSNLIRWPLAALAVWGGVWYLYLFLVEQGTHPSVAMMFATCGGVFAAAAASSLPSSKRRKVDMEEPMTKIPALQNNNNKTRS